MKQYTITQKVQETPDITSLYFVDELGDHPTFRPGQYVTVLFPGLDPSVPEGKAYSLSGTPSDPHMSIAIKAIGTYSNRLCSLQPGDQLTLSEPYGYLYAESSMPLVFLAGGIGISPLMSILRSELELDPTRHVTILYSNKTAPDIAFRDRLDSLAADHPTISVRYHITGEKAPAGSHYHHGRITADVLSRHTAHDSFFAVCGSVSFVTSMYRSLKDLAVPDAHIATETFF